MKEQKLSTIYESCKPLHSRWDEVRLASLDSMARIFTIFKEVKEMLEDCLKRVQRAGKCDRKNIVVPADKLTFELAYDLAVVQGLRNRLRGTMQEATKVLNENHGLICGFQDETIKEPLKANLERFMAIPVIEGQLEENEEKILDSFSFAMTMLSLNPSNVVKGEAA